MQGNLLFFLQSNPVQNVTREVGQGAKDVWNGLSEALTSSLSVFGGTFVSGFMKVLVALIILFIGRIIANIIRRVVEKLLDVSRFDVAAEKINFTDMLRRGNVSASPSAIVSKFVYYLIMLFVMIAAFNHLGWTVISEKFAELINWLPRLFIAGVIFALGYWLANFARDFAAASFKSMGSSAGNMISTAIFYVIMVIVTITAVNQAGIDTSFIDQNISLILGGVLAALAISYGLGARGIMNDLVSGFFKKKKLNTGQRVRIGEVEGEITELDNVSVTVRTGSESVVIPMKKLEDVNIHLLS